MLNYRFAFTKNAAGRAIAVLASDGTTVDTGTVAATPDATNSYVYEATLPDGNYVGAVQLTRRDNQLVGSQLLAPGVVDLDASIEAGGGLSFTGCAIGITYSWADDLVLSVPQYVPIGASGYLLWPSVSGINWFDAGTHPWRNPPTVTVQGDLPPIPETGADADDGMLGWRVLLTTDLHLVDSPGTGFIRQTWTLPVESAMEPTLLAVEDAGSGVLYIDGDGFPSFDPTAASILQTKLTLKPRYS